MRTHRFIRLVLALLLLLSQLASAYALAPGHHGAHAQSASAHCTHAGQPPSTQGSSSTGNCCDQPAGCHCPQAPAVQHVGTLVRDAFVAVVPPVNLRNPPLLLRSQELFRPPI